jgi:hypothetical protein
MNVFQELETYLKDYLTCFDLNIFLKMLLIILIAQRKSLYMPINKFERFIQTDLMKCIKILQTNDGENLNSHVF